MWHGFSITTEGNGAKALERGFGLFGKINFVMNHSNKETLEDIKVLVISSTDSEVYLEKTVKGRFQVTCKPSCVMCCSIQEAKVP